MDIAPDSVFSRSKYLRRGDILVAVNGVDIVGETLERLRARLAALSGPVSLTFHNPAVVDTELAVAAGNRRVGRSLAVDDRGEFPMRGLRL